MMEQDERPAFSSGTKSSMGGGGGDDDEDYRSVNLLEDDSVITTMNDEYKSTHPPSPAAPKAQSLKSTSLPASILLPIKTATTTAASPLDAAGGAVVGTAASASSGSTPFTTSKSSSHFLSPSPGTKTIAALSQDMGDLRYESGLSPPSSPQSKAKAGSPKAAGGGRLKMLQHRCSKDEEEELRKESSSSKAATTMMATKNHQQQQAIAAMIKKPKPQGGGGGNSSAVATDPATAALTAALLQKGGKLPSDFMDRWDVIPVSIQESRGQLGLTIVKNKFPECDSGDHCKVKSVNRSSLGEKYGIKAEDWIGIYDDGSATAAADDTTPSAVMSSFDVVQEMARRRPFEVHLFRQKKKMKNKRSSQAAATTNKKKATPHVVSDSSYEQQQQKENPPTTPLAALAIASAYTAKAEIGGASSPRDLTSLIQAAKALEGEGEGENSIMDVSSQSNNNNHQKSAAGGNSSGNTRKHDSEYQSTTDATNNGSKSANDSNKKSNRLLEGSSRRQRNAQNTGIDRQQQHQQKPTQKEKSTGSIRNSAAGNPRDTSMRHGQNNQSNLLPQTPNNQTAAKGNNYNDKPTFCIRCNATSAATRPRKHHAWCHLNEFFDNSGAQDLMERIQQGRELDCPACGSEFSTGRPISNKNSKKTLRHNSACIKNQKRLKKMAEEREKEAKREEEKQKKAKKKPTQQQKQKQRSRPKPQSPQISSPSSSEDEDDDMEEHSEYRPRQKRRKDRRVSSLLASTGNKKSRGVPAATSAAPKPRDKAPSRVTPQSHAATLEPRAADEATNNGGGKPVWQGVPDAQNPWGPAGHATGDALLYGPLQGLCNTIEAITSSHRRYVVNPFTPSSNYQRTHGSPEEGLAVLVLKRDSLGNQPWGFEVTIDDFGQACLVQSVDPLSPAESATLLGMPDDATPVGLAANDMILLVNGKPVGGMTRGAVDAEIEASGRTLLLAVSRYKHAKEAAEKFATIEQQVLGAIDSATREGQVVGWMEVGHGPQQEPNNGATALEEDGSKNSGLDDESDAFTDHPKVASKNSSEINAIDRDESSESGTVQVEEKKSNSPSPANDRDPIIVQTPLPEQDLSPSNSSSKEGGEGSGSEDWDEDDNAWLGCVCGRVHSKSRNVFWIQCDTCNSWYDVSKNCVGFDSEEAEKIPKWVCWACPSSPQTESIKPTVTDKKDTTHGSNNKKAGSASDSSMPMQVEEREQDDGEEKVLSAVQTEPARKLSSEKKGMTENDGKESAASNTTKTQRMEETAAEEEGGVGSDPVKGGSPAKKGQTGNDTEKEAVVASKIQTRGKKRKATVEEESVESSKRKRQGDSEADSGETTVPPSTNPITGKSPKSSQSPNTKKQERPNDRKKDHMERTTQDGFVRPRKKLIQRSDGTYPKPSGRPFVGMDWDETLGVWKPKNANSNKNRDEPKPSPEHSPGLPISPRKTNNSFEHEFVSPVPATEKVAFKKGDLVYVMAHSWPGRNCQGGIGHIIDSQMDKEGDMAYRVKYILGGSDKDIVPDFIKAHSF